MTNPKKIYDPTSAQHLVSRDLALVPRFIKLFISQSILNRLWPNFVFYIVTSCMAIMQVILQASMQTNMQAIMQAIMAAIIWAIMWAIIQAIMQDIIWATMWVIIMAIWLYVDYCVGKCVAYYVDYTKKRAVHILACKIFYSKSYDQA